MTGARVFPSAGWRCGLAVALALACLPAAAGAAGYSLDCDPASGAGAGVAAERAALVEEWSAQIARRWNLGAVGAEALRSRVVLRVCFTPGGELGAVALLTGEGPSQQGVTELFESARRAVSRAYSEGVLPLPPDRHADWRLIDLEFDASGMVLR